MKNHTPTQLDKDLAEIDAIFADDERKTDLFLITTLTPRAYWFLRFLMNIPQGFKPTQKKVLEMFNGRNGNPRLAKSALAKMTSELRDAGILSYKPRHYSFKRGIAGWTWIIKLPGHYAKIVGD